MDSLVDSRISRAAAMDAVDAWLTEPTPERETWGATPSAVEGQRAMMALAGGPAAMRPQETQDHQ